MTDWLDRKVDFVVDRDVECGFQNWAHFGMLAEAAKGGPEVLTLGLAGVLKSIDGFEGFMKGMTGLGLRCVVSIADPDEYEITSDYVSTHSFLRLHLSQSDEDTISVSVGVATTDRETADKIAGLYEEYVKERVNKKRGQVHMLGTGRNGLELYQLGVAGVEFSPLNYTSDVARGFEHICTELGSTAPTGRLAILTGPPGTGKTYIIRALVEAIEGLFVFIPPGMVSSLGSPDFVPCLLGIREAEEDETPIILIVEDGDMVITKRGVDNTSSVSALLNLADGIFGELLDVRVLITTNIGKPDIDQAIVRRGRLIEHVDVPLLTFEEATKLYQHLVPDHDQVPFTMKMTLADVYAKAGENGWKSPNRKKDKFKAKKYRFGKNIGGKEGMAESVVGKSYR